MKIIKKFEMYEKQYEQENTASTIRDKELTVDRNKKSVREEWVRNHPLEFKLLGNEFECSFLDTYKNSDGYEVFKVYFNNGERYITADCKGNKVDVICELGPRNHSWEKEMNDVEGLEELKTWLHKAMIFVGFNINYYNKVISCVEKCLRDRKRECSM